MAPLSWKEALCSDAVQRHRANPVSRAARGLVQLFVPATALLSQGVLWLLVALTFAAGTGWWNSSNGRDKCVVRALAVALVMYALVFALVTGAVADRCGGGAGRAAATGGSGGTPPSRDSDRPTSQSTTTATVAPASFAAQQSLSGGGGRLPRLATPEGFRRFRSRF